MKSMTGFSSATRELDGNIYSIEIKTVNHRYRDYIFRFPDQYVALEEKLRNKINSKIFRGRIQVYLKVESAKNKEFSIQKDSFDHIYQELVNVAQGYQMTGPDFKDMLVFKDFFVSEDQAFEIEELENIILALMDEALVQLIELRSIEGQRTYTDLKESLAKMKEVVEEINQASDLIEEAYRKKLLIRMKEVLKDTFINEDRILLEAGIFAEKVDIHEEIQRLDSHIHSFQEIMDENGPIGRKLDFLTQEMNREANTICSKINDSDIVKLGVELKSIIEKIREQIQNIE